MSHISAQARAQAGETKKRRTREKLIQAADYVMREQGLSATVEAIAADAGVSVPTFYNVYRSRGDLCAEACGVLVIGHLARTDPPTFQETVNLFMRLCQQRPALVKVGFFHALAGGVNETGYGGTLPNPPKLHHYPYLDEHLDFDSLNGWLAYLIVGDEVAAAAYPRADDPMHVERIATALWMIATEMLLAAAGGSEGYDPGLLEDILRRAAGID